ncbi:O-antigen ligase family protein [Adhaeribacter radiodurans]|uniref:O-antigen ligase family protein n=1 Tax=Adhaeribacter radiodurans TaxID=2745197 RepID=A0A7L7LBW2_9BACT|nr:O-antigen ligase family protein [Adhaeribacter radiodurans]QMU30311.1 O-antigen ligase family protein [Adhaeribacter radiodurans]
MPNILANLKNNRFSEARAQNGLFLLSCLFVVGLLLSRALLSIAPIAMLVWALWQMPVQQSLKRLKQNTPALFLLGFYGLFLLSTLYTDNWAQWRYYITQYLPFLVISCAWGMLPGLRNKQRYAVLFLFVFLVMLLSVGTVIHYFLHREQINAMISHSQNPTSINGISHIYFGVLMALAVFFTLHLYQSPVLLWRKTEKKILAVCLVLIFVSLHIMAFRTGLLAMYVAMLVQVFIFIRNHKQYVLGSALLATIILIPVGAYFTLESVRLRVANTQSDVERYLHNQDINYYSISQRLAAWETALTLVRRNWLLGVAPADVKVELDRQYAVKDFGLKKENQIGLHNQYLNFLVSMGVGGLILLLYTFLYPVIKFNWQQNQESIAFLIIIATAMLVESFFQRQLGLNTFVFFYCLFFTNKESKNQPVRVSREDVGYYPH